MCATIVDKYTKGDLKREPNSIAKSTKCEAGYHYHCCCGCCCETQGTEPNVQVKQTCS